MFRAFSLLAVAFAALISLAAAQNAWGTVKVVPSVFATTAISGYVTFSSSETQTFVKVNVTMGAAYASRNMSIHIHEFADMVTYTTADAFQSNASTFGSHWIGAGNATYGCPETNVFPGFRAGCLGNFMTNANGVIDMTKVFPISQINAGNNQAAGLLSSPIGLGLIIHANSDPCDGSSTNYGARLAGGVIGIVNPNRTAVAYTGGKTEIVATCRFVGTSKYPNIRGSVWLRQTASSSIEIRASVSGIDLGTSMARSMHIHDYGDLSDGVDALRTGPHWNPLNANHSLPNMEPRHQGDLGRVTVSHQGSLWYSYTLTSIDSTRAIYHPILNDPYSSLGRGMIFHFGRDEGCLAPTSNGNAGDRSAQCVIGLAPNSAWTQMLASWPSDLPAMPAQPGNICSGNAPTAVPNPAPSSSIVAPKASSAGIVVPSVIAIIAFALALLF